MSQRGKLDFEALPSIDGMDIFIRLTPSIEQKIIELAFLSETYERARSALMFIFQTKEDDEGWRNDARLRAGLNEFYTMEDAARRDFRLANLGPPSRITASRSPLVHLMYILRHTNVHTRPLPSRVQEITVISRLGGTEHEFAYGAVMLDGVTVQDLQRSREVLESYSSQELEKALAWLLEKQQVFGVSEVFRAGINMYCDEIIASAERT